MKVFLVLSSNFSQNRAPECPFLASECSPLDGSPLAACLEKVVSLATAGRLQCSGLHEALTSLSCVLSADNAGHSGGCKDVGGKVSPY